MTKPLESRIVIGKTLGPYEIVAAFGGGMGEVYLARDTRLDRTVTSMRSMQGTRQ